MKRIIPLSSDAAQQWHPTKNGNFSSEEAHAGSAKKAWWLCPKGHEWEAEIRSLTAGHGCPFCAGNKVWPGFNDLLFLKPNIAAEWHPTKNGTLTADMVTYGSKKAVWWIDALGHEWEAKINSRTSSDHGCPYCAGQKILIGFNDLKTSNPTLADEWDSQKNNLTTEEITSGVGGKFWWICSEGHSYEAYMTDRKKGSGCSYCNNNRVLSGFNDLATLHPEVLQLWDKKKNANIKPEEVSPKSITKVWWRCSLGHSFSMPIRVCVSYENKVACIYCSGSRILAGYNDLQTTHPEIAQSWNEELNTVDIKKISKGSTGKFWWKCGKENHSYQARVSERIKGLTCNICSNNVVLQGFNDIATTTPIFLKQWHPTKNGLITAEDLVAGSSRKVWWLCDKGHEWEMAPVTRLPRVKGGKISGCSTCSAKKFASEPEKEIAALLENLGEEVIRNSRQILKGTELDIYLPKRKIAIEYNGLYWHTEAHKGKTYHYDKWVQCQAEGIQLIQLWEDDWLKDKGKVIKGLLHKIGIADSKRVFARKTSVISIDMKIAKAFLEKNHIQNFASGSHYLALIDLEQNIQAVMVLKKEKNGLNIIRYATEAHVIGGFSKLIKYGEQKYSPDFFVTFSDHSISNGKLYKDNGFVAEKELFPDYMYLVNKERKHKFGYRLKKFRDDPSLKYVANYTEAKLAELNGLARIWDAGKTRWVKTVKPTDKEITINESKVIN